MGFRMNRRAAASRANRRGVRGIMLTTVVAATWIFQSALGGSQEILALCMVSILVGAIVVRMCGVWSSLGMLLMTLILFFPVSALVMKSVMLEPIQEGLFVPETSFRIMCIGMVSASVAAGLVNILGPGRDGNMPFIGPLNQRSLRLFAVLSATFGAFGFLGHDLSGGWGRSAAILSDFLFLVPICLTQMVLERTKGRRSMSLASAVSIGAIVLISIGSNTKQGAIVPIFGYFLTCASFRLRLGRVQTVSAIAAAIFLLAIVAPAINVVRNERADDSFLELLLRTGDTITSILSGSTEAAADTDPDNQIGYSNNYISNRSAGFDRLAFVSYIDATVRFVGSYAIGYAPFMNEAVRKIIPNLFDPGQKGSGSDGDWVLQELGVFAADFAPEITLPLFGEGYVADGFLGVAIWSFCGFGVVSLTLVFVFGSLHRNVLSIFLISMHGFLFCSSGMASLLFFTVRMVPLFVAVYAVCRILGGGKPRAYSKYALADGR